MPSSIDWPPLQPSDGCEALWLAITDPPPIELATAVAAALAKPVGTPPLHALARGRRTAVIIINDATRATPTDRLIGPVMEALGRGGIAPEAVEVVVGVGAHRPASRAEIERMLGADWAARLQVSNHDARANDLVQVGRTGRGTPILLNRRVAEADLRIAFGQVEPHEFAGFTGGRKAILPAVAGYETILRNHSLSMLAHPFARPGILAGNPVHEEMVEAARRAGLDFIVNVALDRELRPIAVAAGDMEAAHEQLVAFLRDHLEVSLPTKRPSVIVTGPGRPLDINLYQTAKALVGIEPLLDADSGAAAAPVVVLLSRCWDGAGSDEMFEPFVQARRQAEPGVAHDAPQRARSVSEAALAALERDYTIEKDEAYYVARVTPKCARVIACCPGVPDARLRALGWEPAAGPESALARARGLLDGEAHAPDGDLDSGRPPLVVFFPRPQRALFAFRQDPAGRSTPRTPAASSPSPSC